MSHSKSVGYLFGIFAAGFYGLNPMFALPLYHDGLDSLSVLFWRYALSVPMLAMLMLMQHIDFRLSKSETVQIALLGAVMALSSLLLYLSYNYMDAGLASTILFVYPIVTAVLMAFVFHERVAPLVWGCLALATVGIGVLCEINGSAHVSIVGVLLSLGSALTYAVYLVFINKGHITHMPPAKVTFFVILFGALMLAVLLLLEGHLAIPQGLHWGYSVGSALFPTALSGIDHPCNPNYRVYPNGYSWGDGAYHCCIGRLDIVRGASDSPFLCRYCADCHRCNHCCCPQTTCQSIGVVPCHTRSFLLLVFSVLRKIMRKYLKC